MEQFKIRWLDGRREPKCAPNPEYPNGIAVNLATAGEASCPAVLQYPAPRVGVWHITCRRCGTVVAVTAAGRLDDPYVARVPCRLTQDAPANVVRRG